MPYDTLPGDELDQIEPARRVRPRNDAATEQDRVSGEVPEEAETFNKLLHKQFEDHAARLRDRSHARRNAVKLKAAVLDREEREELSASDLLGRRQPQDEFQVRGAVHRIHPIHPAHPSPKLTLVHCHVFAQGDINMRTIQELLKMIDQRGFERSPHQLAFHNAFLRATARIIYRDDRGTQRPAIM